MTFAHAVAAPMAGRFAWVRGGGAAAFLLDAGQYATLTDPEGLQAAVVFVVPCASGPQTVAGGMLGPIASAILDQAGADRDAISAVFARTAGLDFDLVQTHTALAGTQNAGHAVTLLASACALYVVCAPSAAMTPDQQAPATSLRLGLPPRVPGSLPAPLAAIKLAVPVPAASARAYRVARGDYIQIIDVDGKQCSDFLAFDAEALDRGQEFGIDPTTTRTLIGNTMPRPGLHAKYFDARMVPLVEIVRDTVGRHDAFMLACAAKYYDDMGYPGHANCSDNFNAALRPFGVPARVGWPAVNFFYNTMVRADGSIGADEPWSRPGDYVLLRALTDVVCASSSCADDVDAANGWNPTDIHVRVYDGANSFSQGVAHRMTPDSEPELTRTSGFHSRTAALSRRMVDYKGYWLADSFAGHGVIDEYWACRERVAVMDLSALRKLEVTGPDAEALLQMALTRDVRKLAVGQVVYSAICNAQGGMIDDATIFRLGQQNFRVVCGDAYCGVWLRQMAAENALQVWVRNATDQLHNLAVQGPRSRDVLAGLVQTPPHQPSIAELSWFRFTIGRLAGVPVLVSRTGYTGELGYEVWCHPDAGVAVWDAIFAAGGEYGIAPLGLAALEILRIEAGLMFAGFEFCDQTDPFAAGIGFAVPAQKTAPYCGAAALADRRAHPQARLVGLAIDSNDATGHGDPVFSGRTQIGVITSATQSPVLGRQIALARLDVRASGIDQRVSIGKLDGHQKRLDATVCRFPHYDPDKTRVRG